MKYDHKPVMLKEVLDALKPFKGGFFLDGTLGGGGYTFSISEIVGDDGMVLGIDLDEDAIVNAKKIIKAKEIKNVLLFNENFKKIPEAIKTLGLDENTRFDGIVVDLGLSSYQLDDRSRGFSFKVDAPIDMAFGEKSDKKTSDILNNYTKEELERIFRDYGEERFASRIAQMIVEARELNNVDNTLELVDIIKSAIPNKFQKGKVHPATKVFQALRIATNNELLSLEEFLPQALKYLKKGGRMAIVSFHSLEDRIVKNFFKQESRGCVCPPRFPICQCNQKPNLKIITKKPIPPSDDEMNENYRSRSAKLRVAEKI